MERERVSANEDFAIRFDGGGRCEEFEEGPFWPGMSITKDPR
jgi:hypothetical protein